MKNTALARPYHRKRQSVTRNNLVALKRFDCSSTCSLPITVSWNHSYIIVPNFAIPTDVLALLKVPD